MKNKKSRLGLSILAGGLSFVGAANATDLIVNGSFELPSDGSFNWAPAGHCGDWGGNVCTGGSSTCANALGWQCFSQYNFTLAYYDGPPVPASENPGNFYSACQATAWTDWSHFTTPQSEAGFMGLNMAQYAASETVMLTDAVLASDIDGGASPIHLQCLAGFLHRQPGTALPGPSVFQHPQRQAKSCRLHQHRRDL